MKGKKGYPLQYSCLENSMGVYHSLQPFCCESACSFTPTKPCEILRLSFQQVFLVLNGWQLLQVLPAFCFPQSVISSAYY